MSWQFFGQGNEFTRILTEFRSSQISISDLQSTIVIQQQPNTSYVEFCSHANTIREPLSPEPCIHPQLRIDQSPWISIGVEFKYGTSINLQTPSPRNFNAVFTRDTRLIILPLSARRLTVNSFNSSSSLYLSSKNVQSILFFFLSSFPKRKIFLAATRDIKPFLLRAKR